MQLNHHELAARLQSWASFYSYEMWMASLATAPLDDALDATLAGPCHCRMNTPQIGRLKFPQFEG